MVDKLSGRRAGVLLHVTSLPSGRLDDDCLRWLDFMAASGLSVWQVLPLVIPDPHGSPYQSRSAYANNPALLPAEAHPIDEAAFEEYCTRHAAWLDDFALFEVLRRRFAKSSWVEWPDAYRHRDPAAMNDVRRAAATEIQIIREQQFRLDQVWHRIRQHAADRDILLFGDIPIFIAHNSADTWAQPEDFLLDDEGCPTYVTGVPPDYFAELGQRWGNPHYDWERMRTDGFAWWLERMSRQFELFDLVRIDHFRGLVAVWMIEASCKTAVEGHWEPTPGDQLLATLQQRYPELPIIAEDLGIITEEVRTLRRKYGLPGMSVLQFAFDLHADNPHKPSNITEDQVAYTGTHDNDTCVGWFNSLSAQQQGFVFEVLGVPPAKDIARVMIQAALATRARIAIAPLQDWLGLDGGARMNMPGSSVGNWSWRFSWDMLRRIPPEQTRSMLEASGRLHAG